MNYHTYFSSSERSTPVQCCMVGVGGFGESFLSQCGAVPLLSARVVVDLDVQKAVGVLVAVGIAVGDISVCQTSKQAEDAWMAGKYVVANDIRKVLDLPLDVVIEATGHPEAGARHARFAIDAGFHVALVTKEVDSVIGPELAARAKRRGRVVTPVDGDQPSLLIGLITWAQVLGLEIVAAGKSSEYDFVYDPVHGTLTSNGHSITCPDFAQWLDLGKRSCEDVATGRAKVASELPQRAVPDLCELAVVANSTGFEPDRPDLHAPIARIVEVADFFSPKDDGGLLSGIGRLDVFHCLRLPGEPSFAGGVFVLVRTKQNATWTMLADKGHVVSRTGRFALIYLPRHLLGAEAATSVLEAGLKSVSSGGNDPSPVVDLVARADRDLPVGTFLNAVGHHHSIQGVSGCLVRSSHLGPDVPAPYYLLANKRLLRPVDKGSIIRCADVEFDETSDMWVLRQDQDRRFFIAEEM
ncbi:flagellar biosynthesis protein FlgA (plasmid) [Agrobacterium leguminum]|uniref:NAD(P)H-dependent oxidoreductase n=1 Tax=Agrobacterium leguminum TaxID=2792015 RepID=UPI00272C374C|nr:flagellar biosynthesis protein FlgA [Agrobacterium leguminum]WLE00756.1 flagellar biosynthesis protein FlgA [Agrobacterium leguminum]